MDATENPRFQELHEAGRQVPHDGRPHQRRHAAKTPRSPASSAPKASACSAPSTCSTARARTRPLFLLRKMILSKTVDERKAALAELFPFVKRDIKATLEAMDGLPVTIRLLDPPLHEFVPQDAAKQKELAAALGIRPSDEQEARRGPARDQPHDGPPRRPPGHHLSRSDRDAGPRDLRVGRRTDEGRQGRPSPRSWSRSPAT